eukprot:TRINITY_DN785_c0_g2_i3.p2 TRINITY_DN785_c0_g2~~TRINITY_DN785_c0_g2_i3.p2  ORF type:complete len:110 (-),score=20.08 TRINITY_DN785_c0_g2_i3:637-966(-)
MTEYIQPALIEGTKYHRITITDRNSQSVSEFFEEATNFIKGALDSGKILVHCNRGISRSTTMVIAFLIRFKNMTYDDAIDLVLKSREIANPNPGFVIQLREYERFCHAL